MYTRMLILALMSATITCSQDGGAPVKSAGATVQDGGDCPVDENVRPIPADASPEVIALLTTLEVAHQGLHSFEANVTYERIEDLLSRREIQTGELLVMRDLSADEMHFAVLFDVHMVGQLTGDLRRETKLNHYIFDGRWLAEIDHERKQFIKRELVPPGRKLNPLKLGEGPIPLPVGQSRDEVLRRFIVTEAALPEDGFLTQLSADAVDGLRLTPRAGVPEADEYTHVDIFYDKVTRLPVGIRAALVTEDVKTVLLKNTAANPEWDDATRAKLNIQEPDPSQWDISKIFWQGG